MTFYSFQVMNKVSVHTSGFLKQRAVVTCEISLTNSFYIFGVGAALKIDLKYHSFPLSPPLAHPLLISTGEKVVP